MLRQKRTRILIVVIVMIAAVSWRGWDAHHQATLDRALVAAVREDDAATTAALLAEGADSNAKDWHEREAHGWLERVQHLFTGHFYEPNPAPVLAIAMGRHNTAINQILRQHHADVDAARYFWLTVFLTSEEKAKKNGVRLLHIMEYPAPSDPLQQAQSWIGKRVAFECENSIPPHVKVGEGVHIEVEFVPTQTNQSQPIVLESCIVGTVVSVDLKRKIIRIRSQYQDWHIGAIG